MNKCEDKDRKSSIEKVHTFCNDLISRESIKEKPPIYLLATLVDINRDKNQEEALKVSSTQQSSLSILVIETFGDSVLQLQTKAHESCFFFEGLVWRHDFLNILQLCDDLATEHDVIRREYWGYIKRSIQMSKG